MSDMQRQSDSEAEAETEIDENNDKQNHAKSQRDNTALKLPLPYLDEMHGDSSLEPGEVKTPPRLNSKASGSSARPITDKAEGTMLRKSKPSSSTAWLPLSFSREDGGGGAVDGKRNGKGQRSNRSDSDGSDGSGKYYTSRKAKEQIEGQNRESSKIIKGATLPIVGGQTKIDKSSTPTIDDSHIAVESSKAGGGGENGADDDDSEGLYSSSGSTPERSEEMRLALKEDNSANGEETEQVMRSSQGFRAFHPDYRQFVRHNRLPDFMHSRGGSAKGYYGRGRSAGGMRGKVRFPYRTTYFNNGVKSRHQMPYHASRLQSASPTSSDSTLFWTKAKPTISYAFKGRFNPKHEKETDQEQREKLTIDQLTTDGKLKKTKDNSSADNTITADKKRSESKEKKLGKKFQTRDKSIKTNSEYTENRQREDVRDLALKKKGDRPSASSYECVKVTTKAEKKVLTDAKAEKSVEDLAKPRKVEQQEITLPKAGDIPNESSKDLNQGKVENGKHDFIDIFSNSPPPLSTIPNQEENRKKSLSTDGKKEELNVPKLAPTKMTHQKAIETQKRIDKLLQEDDFSLETIKVAKEMLLQTKKKKTQQAIAANTNPISMIVVPEKKQSNSSTPEAPKRIRNPFKRSISRDRFHDNKTDGNHHHHRSRSNSWDRQQERERKNLSIDRSRQDHSHDNEQHGRQQYNKIMMNRLSSSSSIEKRSKSRDSHSLTLTATRNRTHERNMERKSRNISRSPLRQLASEKSKSPASNSRSHTPPRSIDSKKTRQKTDKKISISEKSMSASKISRLSFNVAEFVAPGKIEKARDAFEKKITLKASDSSPDTDDYMDNWESDTADLETGYNPSSDKIIDKDDSVTRFANPSPPVTILPQDVGHTANEGGGATPPLPVRSTKHNSKSTDLENTSEIGTPSTKNVQLFGMQEIYDQFIKSVEGSGVEVKTSEKRTKREKMQEKEHNSTSSSSSPSTSSSYSSDASNSSSSYSSSTPSTSSDDSCDNEKVSKHSGKPTPTPKSDVAIPAIVIKEEPLDQSPIHVQSIPTLNAEIIAMPSCKSEIEVPDNSDMTTPPPRSVNGDSPDKSVKSSRSAAAKDFKKLKSLEANLARIQLMQANYDSTDDISEELHKMERLFMQERNFILQKYAKKPTTATTMEKAAGETDDSETMQETQIDQKPQQIEVITPGSIGGQFVSSLQEANIQENANSKIFDRNREAIKLTISPLKLSRTPAIFDRALADDAEQQQQPPKRTLRVLVDEIDFTEKLAKPAKEIAIVKPIMETKESKELRQRSRRPSSRSPGGGGNSSYRSERSRRSTSRGTRSSPKRRSRGWSTSPSRRGGSRHAFSPHRRIGRHRIAGGRRTRSRSKSPSLRQGNRRDFSPLHRRRRDPFGARKRGSYRHARDSRSRSPRPHSPRSPPPVARRSWSRECYSRSPLPFKPPSPPLRRGTLSRSHSRSPRMPRSPRSPPPGCYDDYGRYERRSASPMNDYYGQDAMMAGNSSSYYYNVDSPNRLSLDARINFVLNEGMADAAANITSYDAYSSYSSYGAYMTLPPQPPVAANAPPSSSYYANPYLQMADGSGVQPQTSHLGYSTIPTIGGSSTSHHSINLHGQYHGQPTPTNYYNNEDSVHVPIPAVAVKELPKTVAVQKGNVLEIVPFAGATSPLIDGGNSSLGTTEPSVLVDSIKKMKKPKEKSVTMALREEVKSRQDTVAEIQLTRPKDCLQSILKGIEVKSEPLQEEEIQPDIAATSSLEKPKEQNGKTKKKKVFFVDGIFPQCTSEDEDRKIVEEKVHRRLKKLRRKNPELNIPSYIELLPWKAACAAERYKKKIEAARELPPPPPPSTPGPPPHLEQPVYLRPPTPTQMLYFHYDPLVHSMYVSQLDRPIPPRLLNAAKNAMLANSAPPASGSGNASAASPSLVIPKKEIGSGTPNRPARNGTPSGATDSAAPKTIPILQRHENAAGMHLQHPHLTVDMAAMTKGGSFQSISPHPPPQPGLPRPVAPIGFVGMRLNTLTRLPSSPLARNAPLLGAATPLAACMSPIPVLGVRHNYQIPPPTHSNNIVIGDTSSTPTIIEAIPSIITSVPPPLLYNGIAPDHLIHGTSQPPPGYFTSSTETTITPFLSQLTEPSTLINVMPPDISPPQSTVNAIAAIAASAVDIIPTTIDHMETTSSTTFSDDEPSSVAEAAEPNISLR